MISTKNDIIYIELDCLFDTRLGTINRLNPDLATKLVATDYRHRITDDFDKFVPEINMVQYEQLYRARDWITLANSVPTEFSTDLNRMLDELLFDPRRLNPNSTVEIHVNSYPYELTDEEKVEYVQALHEITASVFHFKIVDIPPRKLDLNFIKESNYVCMFVYDLNSLISNCITETSIKSKTRCNDVMLYAPQIALDFEELKKTIEESERMGEKFEPFAHTSLILSPFIALEFVSSEYYSMADFTKHLKEYELEQELNSSNKGT